MDLHRTISQWTKDEYETEYFRGMAAAYRQEYRGWFREAMLMDVERHIEKPLLDSNWSLQGYIDKLIKTPQLGLCLVDHKTTTEDLHPGSRYWARLENDPQSTMYLLLATLDGLDVDTILWDVAKKPSIKPKKLTKKQLEEVKEKGTYFDHELEYPDRVTELESPECYGIRVFLWCRDNNAFQRHWLIRTPEAVESVLVSSHQVARLIDAAKIMEAWPQNFGACVDYGRPCDYAPICHEGCPLDSRYYEDKPVRECTLSHSSIQDWHRCPRRFYYRKVLGKVPVHVESEALRQGGVWHNVMDVLYKEFCHGEGSSNTGS